VNQVASIDVILVHNETESLILENNLIKRHQPPFNQVKKEEGTGYYYIVLTREALPRLLPYRKARFNSGLIGPDGHLVPVEHRFGPYLQWRVCHRLLDLVADRYGLRTCHPLPRRACLRLHMGGCRRQNTYRR
jgi:excinuclease ABC subunit C